MLLKTQLLQKGCRCFTSSVFTLERCVVSVLLLRVGVEKTLKISRFQPPAMSRGTFHQFSLLQALSNLASLCSSFLLAESLFPLSYKVKYHKCSFDRSSLIKHLSFFLPYSLSAIRIIEHLHISLFLSWFPSSSLPLLWCAAHRSRFSPHWVEVCCP